MNEGGKGVVVSLWIFLILSLQIVSATQIDSDIEFIQKSNISPKTTQPDILTLQEREWLKEHTDITFLSFATPPTGIRKPDGTVEGFATEYTDLLNERLGTQFKLDFKPLKPATVKQFTEKSYSGFFPSVADVEERKPYFIFSDPILSIEVYVFTRFGSAIKLKSLDDLKGKRVGHLVGHLYVRQLLSKYPGMTIKTSQTPRELLDELLNNKVDVIIGSIETQYAVSQGVMGLVQLDVILPEKQPVGYTILKTMPELKTIINKGLSLITHEERDSILDKWLLTASKPKPLNSGLNLTDQEAEWVSKHQTITFGYPHEFQPYIYTGLDGKPKGYSAELIRILADRTGIDIQLKGGDWPEITNMAKQRSIDGLPVMAVLNKWKSDFIFTKPFLTSYVYIYARTNEADRYKTLKDLQGKKVIYIKNVAAVERILENNPNIESVAANNTEETAQALLEGSADVILGSIGHEYWRHKNVNAGFKIAALLPETQVSIAIPVRKDWPELVGILNKALESISYEEKLTLEKSWLGEMGNYGFLHKAHELPTPNHLDISPIVLSSKERQWLKENPVIELGFNPWVQPLVIQDDKNKVTGIMADIYSEMEKMLGVKIEIKVGDWSETLDKASKGSIHGVAACTQFAADKNGLLTSQSVLNTVPIFFARHDAPFKINSMDDLKNKRVAYMEGIVMMEALLKPYEKDIEIITAPNVFEAARLVLEGKADVFMGNSFDVFIIREKLLYGLDIVYVDIQNENPLYVGVNSDNAELVEILNKGFKAMGKPRIHKIVSRWLNINPDTQKSLPLTDVEEKWLRDHPVINVVMDPEWAPVEFKNENGEFAGISMEYLKQLETVLGVTFNIADISSWDVGMTQFRNKKLDMVSSMAKTQSREAFALFTDTYVSMPINIFASDRVSYIGALENLNGKKVAVVKGYAIAEWIKKDYPEIKLVEVKTISEALQYITAGKADAFVENIVTASYYIGKFGLTHIRVAGETPYKNEQRMAVRNDWGVFAQILQKALNTIEPPERDSYYNRWMSIRYDVKTDPALLIKVIFAAGVILAIIILLSLVLQRKKDKDLLESQQTFVNIVDRIPAGIFIYQFVEPDRLYLINGNPDALRQTGLDLKKNIGKELNEVWPNARTLGHADFYLNVARTGVTDTIEDTYYKDEKLDTAFSVKAFTLPGNRLVVSFENTTEKKMQKEELVKANQLFETLVESTTGHIGQQFFNNLVDKLCSIFECECAIISRINGENKAKAIAMKSDGVFVDDHAYDLVCTPCNEVVQKGFSLFEDNVCKLFPEDNDLINMKARGYIGAPVVNASGDVIGVLCAISKNPLDVGTKAESILSVLTARVAVEMERMDKEKQSHELSQRLQQSQKMEAVGQLAGGIAHDFNNILGGILGYTDLAISKTQSNKEVVNYLNKVMGAGERAKDLVSQILLFSRQNPESKVVIPLKPVINEAIELLRATLPSSIEIKVDLKDDTIPVFADPTKIHETIMNLCTNAAYAMDKKGIISIEYREVQLLNDIEGRLGPIKSGSYSLINIRDSGCGMSEEVVNHIFEPYFTTKEIGKGTGMGLSVVFGIMQSHEGNIQVETKINEGTVFKVYIPKTEETVTIESEEEISIPRGDETIIFVDDEEMLVDMSTITLKGLGYTVHPFTSSRKALAFFKSDPRSIDLIITDHTMPNMSGLELARELLAIRGDIPIVLCTGYSDTKYESQVLKVGIHSFLTKPIRKNEIAFKIRSLLD